MNDRAAKRDGAALFAVTIFLSAFLLFQVQLVIGKCILPWFGSTPGVWTTCLLFFQIVLLLGYTYAHVIARTLSPRGQAATHVALLGLTLLLLPITPSEAWKPDPGDSPTWRILLVLAVSVGAPYLLLSATGPLLSRCSRTPSPAARPTGSTPSPTRVRCSPS